MTISKNTPPTPDKKNSITKLCTAIENEPDFPKNISEFSLFLFSNEYDVHITLRKMEKITPAETTKIKIALLLGESHILSMLPEISLHADMVLCNDINKNVNLHTQFLIDCIKKSATRIEFAENYKNNNPLCEKKPIKELWGMLSATFDLQEKHFLFSEERYLLCKNQAEKLQFSWSQISLFKPEHCQILMDLLGKYNATISLLNLTNLHGYSHFAEEKLDYTNVINTLLPDDNQSIVLYSIGTDSFFGDLNLRSKINVGKEEYLNILKEMQNATFKYHFTFKARLRNVDKSLLVMTGNAMLKKLALQHDIPITYLPKLTHNNKKIRLDINEVADAGNDYFTADMRHQFYLLFKEFLPWNNRRYDDEEGYFSQAKIYLCFKIGQLPAEHLFQNTYFFVKEKLKLYYVAAVYDDRKKLLQELPVNETKLAQLMQSIDLYDKGPESLRQLEKVGTISRETTKEFIELIAKQNPARFILSKFGKKVHASDLFNFIQNNTSYLSFVHLVEKANNIIKNLAEMDDLPEHLMPKIVLHDINKKGYLLLPPLPIDQTEMKKIFSIIIAIHPWYKNYIDESCLTFIFKKNSFGEITRENEVYVFDLSQFVLAYADKKLSQNQVYPKYMMFQPALAKESEAICFFSRPSV